MTPDETTVYISLVAIFTTIFLSFGCLRLSRRRPPHRPPPSINSSPPSALHAPLLDVDDTLDKRAILDYHLEADPTSADPSTVPTPHEDYEGPTYACPPPPRLM